MVGRRLGQVRFGYVMLHSYVTDMAARVTPTIQIPVLLSMSVILFPKILHTLRDIEA